MWLKFLKTLIVGAFFIACAPPEFESLEDVVIGCDGENESQAEPCPEDYYCETRVEPAECRPSVGRDVESPQVDSPTVSPGIAKQATVLLSNGYSKAPNL